MKPKNKKNETKCSFLFFDTPNIVIWQTLELIRIAEYKNKINLCMLTTMLQIGKI